MHCTKGPPPLAKRQVVRALCGKIVERSFRHQLPPPHPLQLATMAEMELELQKGLLATGTRRVLEFIKTQKIGLLVFPGSTGADVKTLLRLAAQFIMPPIELPPLISIGRITGVRIREITDFEGAYSALGRKYPKQFCEPLDGKTILVVDDTSGAKAQTIAVMKIVLGLSGAEVPAATLVHTPSEEGERMLDAAGPPLDRGVFFYGLKRIALTNDTGNFWEQVAPEEIRIYGRRDGVLLESVKAHLRDVACRAAMLSEW